MTKQEALNKLRELIADGFYFHVEQDILLTEEADNLLYRARQLETFYVYEFFNKSINDWKKYGADINEGVSAWYDCLGLSIKFGTYFVDRNDDDERSEYGKNAQLVSLEYFSELLTILESEEDTETPTKCQPLSVKAAKQTNLGEIGVSLELGIVNHVITVEEAKELSVMLDKVLWQFSSELNIGDVVSDNEQALIVYGVDGDNIWCKNEQSKQFFTKKRGEVFLLLSKA